MFENEYKDQKAGIHCIATGLEYPMVDDYIMSAKQLDFKYTNFDNMAKDIKASFISKKNRWKKAAEKAPRKTAAKKAAPKKPAEKAETGEPKPAKGKKKAAKPADEPPA